MTKNVLFQVLRRARAIAARIWRYLVPLQPAPAPSYAERMGAEARRFDDELDVNALPAIFHYWSNRYLRPMLEECGVSNPDQFFAKYLIESAHQCADESPTFISIGSGNCDTEVRVAKLLAAAGARNFVIECLDINPHMLRRGHELAEREGVEGHIVTIEGDFNHWIASRQYTAAMANQSLHHVVNLEGLFDELKRAVHPGGYLVVSDMIGRNGHQRWPEALAAVQEFWKELPRKYRYNRQLKRHESRYRNWDCSPEGFEGVRAQDILPLLLERFHFHVFIGFANVVDVFIDRAFGHNFDAERAWDRDFIDRVHVYDEQAFQDGRLTPTHMMAVLTNHSVEGFHHSRGLAPVACIRDTNNS